jgi:hypothetical protein
MKEATKRSIVRWIHIFFSIPILGYIYSPFEKLPGYATRPDMSSFLPWSFQDCGCGKATSSDDLFRAGRLSDFGLVNISTHAKAG